MEVRREIGTIFFGWLSGYPQSQRLAALYILLFYGKEMTSGQDCIYYSHSLDSAHLEDALAVPLV